MKVVGNATAYVGGREGRPLPKPPETLHRAHRPWCVDCKTKHDADDLDKDGRCTTCAATAVRRAKAAEHRAEREAAFDAAVKEAAAEERAAAAAKKAKVAAEQATPARAPRTPTPAPTTGLPQAGNPGQPTTRSSAPRATSSSGTSGRAPDAGSANHREKNPPAAPEARPAAAGGPSLHEPEELRPHPAPTRAPVLEQLDARISHIERVVRRASAVDDPIVGMLRTSVLASIEALHVYLELHHSSTRGVDGTSSADVAGQTSPGPHIPQSGGGQPAADAADPPARQPADTPRKPPRARRPGHSSVDTARIVQLYTAGRTIRQVHEDTGYSTATIRRHLADQGVTMRPRGIAPGTTRTNDDPELVEQVRRLYLDEHLTQAAIAESIGASSKLVQGIMARHEITARPAAHVLAQAGIGHAIKIPHDDRPQIVERYQAGESAAEIAQTYDCTRASIYFVLDAAGVPRHGRRIAPGHDGARGLKDLMADTGVTSRQVKDWALQQGLIEEIAVGLPARALVDAYLTAHTTEGEPA